MPFGWSIRSRSFAPGLTCLLLALLVFGLGTAASPDWLSFHGDVQLGIAGEAA